MMEKHINEDEQKKIYTEQTYGVRMNSIDFFSIIFNEFWGMWQVYMDGSLYAEFKTKEEAEEYAHNGRLHTI